MFSYLFSEFFQTRTTYELKIKFYFYYLIQILVSIFLFRMEIILEDVILSQIRIQTIFMEHQIELKKM